jgi:heme exporter protein C
MTQTAPHSSAQASRLSLTALANPARFMRVSSRVLPWLWGLAVLVLATGFYGAWFTAPADYQQGETIRIMYLHVPAAWLAMAFYAMMAVSAVGTLVWRHPLADVAQRAAAPIGASFAAVCLITGALWGKPMWGTYWVWDARLTSMLVLLLMYCGLMALWSVLEDDAQAGKAVSIITLVGVINLPIIKFSVEYWNTLHQPASVFRAGGPSIAPSMLWPLLVCAIGFTLLAVALHLTAMRTELMTRRARTLAILAAQKAA